MTDATSFQPRQLARLLLVLLLAFGCWSVLQPFLPAILFSLAICVSSWPAYRWLQRKLGGRRNTASVIACLVIVILVITPTIVLILSLGDAAAWLARMIEERQLAGPIEAPAWLLRMPLLGPAIGDWLREVSSDHARLSSVFSGLADPARKAALAAGTTLGRGVGQGLLAVVLLFFLYRDGAFLGQRLRTLAQRLGGDNALALLSTAQHTIAGVMFSVIGTALAQAMVAMLGFSIAGVPNPVLLGAVTFVLSMAPIGPPLVWGGAALWLFRQGDTGWAIFMALYGFFCISLVDNILKPFLISRSSHLPFVLTFMGVIGGVLAFGVAGVFVGPTALALAIKFGKQRFLNDEVEAEAPPKAQK